MSNNLSDKLKEKAAETALLVGAAAILGLVCAGPAGAVAAAKAAAVGCGCK
jgi:ABC-type dipeptide/oligopeptide/nickel transport system permease component